MTLLPIVERELRVAARRPGTYWLRVLAAFTAIALFLWTLVYLAGGGRLTNASGQSLFRNLISFAFVACLFAGARLTSDTISHEKREDTLGLLFLTDLKGYDIVLGKLAATAFNSLYALLAVLPVFAVTTQLGGVSLEQFVTAAALLINTLLFSLASGILASSLCRHERKAMSLTLLLVLVVTLGPPAFALLAFWFLAAQGFLSSMAGGSEFFVWLSTPSPAFALVFSLTSVSAFLPTPPAMALWTSIAVVHLLTWGFLATASFLVPRGVQRASLQRSGGLSERLDRWAYGKANHRRHHRQHLLDLNPFLWLVQRERWKVYYGWFYLLVVSLTWFWGLRTHGRIMLDAGVAFAAALVVQTFMKIWIAAEACNRLSEDRRNGALELLLSTPLSVRQILHGQWLALARQFLLPLLVLISLEALLFDHAAGEGSQWNVQLSALKISITLILLAADAVTLGWLGMWLGLASQNTGRALVTAITRVILLPTAAYYAVYYVATAFVRPGRWRPHPLDGDSGLWLWLALGIAFDLGFSLWARACLQRDFRRIAVQTGATGWRGVFRRWSRGTPA